MNGTQQQLRDLAVGAYLWGQRRKWPLPQAARRFVRRVFARQVDQFVPIRTDKWGRTSDASIYGHSVGSSPGGGSVFGATKTSSPRSIQWLGAPLRPEVGRRLRCVVATGTLKLGGQEMVALCLAQRLPALGLDTVVAHTPWDRSDEETTDMLSFHGVPVVRLTQHNVGQWLATHRPDVISVHGASDWFVTAAAAARIPVIETLHGTPSLFGRSNRTKERSRSSRHNRFCSRKRTCPTTISKVQSHLSARLRRHHPQWGRRPTHRPAGSRPSPGVAWLARRSFLFVSLARYHIQKNTFGLVAAFSDVVRAYPEARLLCAGEVADPSYFEQVRRLRDRLPCARQIRSMRTLP